MGRQAEGPWPACGAPGRKISWPAALLAAAILSSCFLLTQAVNITVMPSLPLKGQDVTLTPGGTLDFLICSWFRGENAETNRILTYIPSTPEQQNGPAFTERETAGPGCSLHIRSLMLNDTGIYTLSKIVTGSSEKGSVHIEVFERVSNVTITSHPTKAVEHQSTVLNCSSAGSNVSYIWSKGNQILQSAGHISVSYNSLTFSPTSRNDTGNYICYGNNNFSNSSSTYRLDVFYGPDAPVISPQQQYYAEGSDLNLHCFANSYLPPQYTWYFNETELSEKSPQLSIPSLSFDQAGNYTCKAFNNETNFSSSTSLEIKVLEKLSRPILWPTEYFVKEHMNITLNCNTSEHSSVNVSWLKDESALITDKSVLSKRNRVLTILDISKDDEGIYKCEARNRAVGSVSNPSKITVDSEGPPGLTAGAIVGIVIGCLVGVVLIVAVLYFVLKSATFGRMPQHSSNGNIPSAPGHNQGVTDTKPTAGEEDIQYTTLAFNAKSPSQPGLGPTAPLESGTIYSEIKKK